MCCSVSASFITFSVIALVSMFTLTLLNMIFSCLTPKEYYSFIERRASTFSSLGDLKKENSYDITDKYVRTLIQAYTSKELDELNDKVQKHKSVLMAFGITSFSVLGGFIIFFVPIYSSFNCGANCSQECDCNCDCYLCIGVNPIKRIILFYLVCFPTVFFSIISFFLTIAKKSTYSDISSKKDIDVYRNRKKKSYGNGYEDDYYGDSVTYNQAQFIIYLIILIILVVYPLLVWLFSSKEEMNPPIIPYQKKVHYQVRNINENTNQNTELYVDLSVSSSNRKANDVSYNSQPPQPQYRPPPPQPQYRPPPPQPQYRPPPPPPQPHFYPPPPHHPHPPHIGIPLPRLFPPEIVISIH